MSSFERFGDGFQSKILYHVITDKLFAIQILEILDPDYFSNDKYVELAMQIVKWNEQYSSTPTFENLTTIVRTEYEDDIETEYLLDLIDIISKITDVSDKKFVQEKTVKFCKQRSMENAIIRSAQLLKDTRLEDDEKFDMIGQVVAHAQTAGEAKDIGHSFEGQVLARTVAKRFPVKTGWPMLDDEYVAGGLSGGELGIILGGTGAGKSFMLANLAHAAFCQGKTTVFYSFELREYPVGFRLDSKFTKIPLTQLLLDIDGKHRETVAKAIKVESDKHDIKPEIIIKEYPTKSASLAKLKNHYNQLLASGIKPHMIVVDYADLMRPSTRYKDKRFELESIVEELRGWAHELDVPIWTASQTNREGLDTSVVTLKTISEALSKAMVADLIISIGRSPELQQQGRACYYLAKNRLGRDKVAFTGEFDTSIMNFTIDTEGIEEDLNQQDNQGTMNRAVQNVITNANNRNSDVIRDLMVSMTEVEANE
jgi:replicative DNA helicase